MNFKEILKTISRREWFFVFAISLLVVIVTSLPLLFGIANTPSDKIFTGTHFAAPNDWFVYYSHIEQAKEGRLFFVNLFTVEPHHKIVYIFWFIIGLFAKLFNLSPLAAFNISRVFLIFVLLSFLYIFSSYLFTDKIKRKLSLIILSFSSGLGLLLIYRIIKYPYNFTNGRFTWPFDLWVPESNTFLTMYYSPHFITSLLCIVLIFFTTLLYVDSGRVRYSFYSGLSALFLFAFHPFHVITIFTVIFAYFVILFLRGQKFLFLLKHYLILFCLSLPSIFYYIYLLKFDTLTATRAAQNITLSTSLPVTIIGYGFLFLFSIFALKVFIERKEISNKELFILVWFIAQFLILYFPVNYQRRLSAGLHVPMSLLTVYALVYFYHYFKNSDTSFKKFIWGNRYVVIMALVTLMISSNLFQVATDFFMYKDQRLFTYVDKSYVEAAYWLRDQGLDHKVFNSSENIINLLPAYSLNQVYVGHGVETPSFRQKQLEVEDFFVTNRSEDFEQAFLRDRGIDTIFYSNKEKILGDYNPESKSYLSKIYSNDKVSIYKVL